MALLTAKGIASVAAELLTRTIVLPRTATRISGGDFAGDNGDTITVRVPQPGAARKQVTRGTQIVYDEIHELPVDVTLSHLYNAKLVSDEELSLDIVNFGTQVTRVQVAAVATSAEDELAAKMNDLDVDAPIEDGEIFEAVLAAREYLGENDAPAGDRYLAVSPSIASLLLAEDKLVRVDASGSSSALRDAIIGRVYGFTVVESNALDHGTAVAYHQSGFCFAVRVPVEPRGAAESGTAESGGIGLRQIFQYDPDRLSDASVISTFAGAAAVLDEEESAPVNKRFFKIALDDS